MAYLVFGMNWIGEQIRKMQENKYDCLVVFTGKRGIGKSTGAIKLANRIGKFNMKKDIVFARDDLMRQLSVKRNGIIVADEMINVTFNRDFWSEEQKTLIKMLNMYRDRCNILIACVPNFTSLDKQFLKLVKMRIDVVRRGLAVIHTQREGSFLDDPWDTKNNQKIETKWYKKGVSKPNYARLSTYLGVTRYGSMSPVQEEAYQRIKDEKRNILMMAEDQDKAEQLENIYDKLVKRIKQGGITKQFLEDFCELNSLQYPKMQAAINYRLKNQGLKALGSFLVSDKSKRAPSIVQKIPNGNKFQFGLQGRQLN